jgi:hypothetical protein
MDEKEGKNGEGERRRGLCSFRDFRSDCATVELLWPFGQSKVALGFACRSEKGAPATALQITTSNI